MTDTKSSAHADITPGLWYLRINYAPYYTVVSVTRYAIGPQQGEMGVWMIDEEGSYQLEEFSPEQFIGPVPPPTMTPDRN